MGPEKERCAHDADGPEINAQRRWCTIVQMKHGKSSSSPQPPGTFFTVGSRPSLSWVSSRKRLFSDWKSLSAVEEEQCLLLGVCFSWLIAETTPLLEFCVCFKPRNGARCIRLREKAWSLNWAGSLLGVPFFFSVQIIAERTSSLTLCACLN